MTDTAAPVAAWYPDPSGHADLRWWDGTRWTPEVRSRAVAAPVAPVVPVAPTAAVTPVGPVAPVTPVASASPYEDRAALYAARSQAHFAETEAIAPVAVGFSGAGGPGRF